MNYLNERYVKIYTHRGFDICTLKKATPSAGDELGYVIDSKAFEGRIFNLIDEAADAIDDYLED